MQNYNSQDKVNIFRYVLVNGRPEKERYTFIRPDVSKRLSGDPLTMKIRGLPGKWIWDSCENAHIKVENKKVGDGGIWYGNPFEFPLEDGVIQINKSDYENLMIKKELNLSK